MYDLQSEIAMHWFCEIKNPTFIKISGRDSTRFLQNVCTNDVVKMKVGDGLFAGFCSRAGKPQLLADIKRLAESTYLLRLENITPASAIEFLQHYIIMDNVTVEEESNYHRFYICAANSPITNKVQIPQQIFSFVNWNNNLVFKHPYTSKNDIGIISANNINSELQAEGFESVPDNKLEELRIKYGYPVWGKEVTPDYLLEEANLSQIAISYTKGCYTGQEVIMRMKTYGELPKKLMFIESNSEIKGNTIEKDSKTIGIIVSSTLRNALSYIVKPYYQQHDFSARCGNLEVTVRRTGFDQDYNRYN
jgi:folate-binding protein YgfZ